LLTPHYGALICTAATCVVVRRLVNQLLSSLGDALTAAKQVRPLPLEDWVLRKDEKNELRDVTVTELHACRFAMLSYPHTMHVWQYLPQKSTKGRNIYHTWMLWVREARHRQETTVVHMTSPLL